MKQVIDSVICNIYELWRVRLFLCRYVYRMKTTFYIIVLLAIITGCNSFQQPIASNRSQTINVDTLRIANDSLEYEVIIIEPGFYGWLATQPQRGHFAQSTLEIKNGFYVREYNLRVNNPQQFDPNLYQLRIDYNRNIDYGYEVNYLLYNYFLFFEKRYAQNLQ